jgi:hypothetical protein
MGLRRLSSHKRNRILLTREIEKTREFTYDYEAPLRGPGTNPPVFIGSMILLGFSIAAILLGLLSILNAI